MTDGEIFAAVAALATAAGGGVMTLGRWLGGVWRDIRREEIAAAKETAAAQRAGEQRMVDALIKQAESNGALAIAQTHLGHKIDGLSSQLYELAERTPVEPIPRVGDQRRARTNPHGYRPPRPGEHDD